jgi:hypothetical protein
MPFEGDGTEESSLWLTHFPWRLQMRWLEDMPMPLPTVFDAIAPECGIPEYATGE